MPGRFLREMRTDGPGIPLVVFPPAGRGAVSAAGKLAVEANASMVVLPGRGVRFDETPARRIADILEPLCDEIVSIAQDGRVALVGHSLGAYVAHAVASRLEAEATDVRVEALGVAAAEAPVHQPTLVRHLLNEDEFAAELAVLGGTPPELFDDPALSQVFLPLLRADFEMAETYSPDAEPLRCPIAAFAGRDDADVDLGGMRRWEQLTKAAFTLREFEGGHFFADDNLTEICSDTLRSTAC